MGLQLVCSVTATCFIETYTGVTSVQIFPLVVSSHCDLLASSSRTIPPRTGLSASSAMATTLPCSTRCVHQRVCCSSPPPPPPLHPLGARPVHLSSAPHPCPPAVLARPERHDQRRNALHRSAGQREALYPGPPAGQHPTAQVCCLPLPWLTSWPAPCSPGAWRGSVGWVGWWSMC